MKKNTFEEVSFLCFPSSVVQSKLRLSSIDCEMFLDLPILKYFLSANYLIPAQIISVCLVRWLFIIIRTCSHWTHEILRLGWYFLIRRDLEKSRTRKFIETLPFQDRIRIVSGTILKYGPKLTQQSKVEKI